MNKLVSESKRLRERARKLKSNPRELSIQEDLIESMEEPLNKFEQEHNLMTMETNIEARIGNNTWLADSGASSHMTHSGKGMFNVRHSESLITVGNGKSIKSIKIGDIRVMFTTNENTND